MAKNFQTYVNDATRAVGETLSAINDLPNTRLLTGITNRDKQIMTWMLPNGTTVQMYINPENLVIAESKQIQSTRTKGGFVVQYWGENLTKLTLNGTTGSAGVKGINVLRDIYHAENKVFEIVAGTQTNDLLDAVSSGAFNSVDIGQSLVPWVSQQLRNNNFILRPSLASLALGIVLFYQGIEYKGFFNSLTVTENVTRLGLFEYNMDFTVTEIRGKRSNFMAWHKDPLSDDPTGQIVNALASAAGNAVRGFFGMNPQQNAPTQFHPESGPLSFGGSSLAAQFGVNSSATVGGSGAPRISDFSPKSGIPGTQITISGSNFTDVTSVSFTGKTSLSLPGTTVSYNSVGASFEIIEDTKMNVTVPSNAKTGIIEISSKGASQVTSQSFTVIVR